MDLLRIALFAIALALILVIIRHAHVAAQWRARPRSWFNPGGK